MRLSAIVFVAGLVLSLGCGKKKGEPEAEQPSAEAAKPKEPALELHPFWTDSDYLHLKDEARCPEALWPLFPGKAPGADPAEVKQNEAARAGLAAALRQKTFVVHLVGPSYVTIGDYDSAAGRVEINVSGSVDCTDDAGRITFAFGKPAAVPPEGREFGQYTWSAAPLAYPHSLKMSESRSFQTENKVGLEARVVFQLGKAEVHKKLVRNEISAEERAERKKHDIPDEGGGMEDWGAGRLVRTEILGIRVASQGGRQELVMQRKP